MSYPGNFRKRQNYQYERNAVSPTPAVDPNKFQSQAAELIPAEVRMISGCHSAQTSADLSNVKAVAQLPNPAGKSGGAATSALLGILNRELSSYRRNNLTFQNLLLNLRESLANSGLEQIPQLTSSRPLDVSSTPFTLVGGNGERRALLVGINYVGQNGQLSGCHNDVFNMKKFIKNVYGYPERNITVLVDDISHAYPTRQKIMSSLQNLVAQSKAGDSVYFHYSGHGGLLDPEFNVFKINSDKYDETIYPVDHGRSGQIRDFSLFNKFVKPMASGVTVTCVMDCCHSGSVLDLPYSFQPTEAGTIRSFQNFDTLSNLAFLYILAGGYLPPTEFGDVYNHMDGIVDGSIDDYQGVGIESADHDEIDYDDGNAFFPAEGDGVQDDGFNFDENVDEPVVVSGTPVPDEDVDYGYVPVVPGETVDYGDQIDDGPVVPEEAVADDCFYDTGEIQNEAQEYEDTGFMNREFFSSEPNDYGEGTNIYVDDDNGGDIDCDCFSDVLGALLDFGGDD